MKEMTSKFMIATAILAAPAAGTALQASAQTVAVQPEASREAVSAAQTSEPRLQAVEAALPSPAPAAARIGSIQEFTPGGPSFVINGPMKKALI